MNEPVIKVSGVTKIYNIRERGYRSFKDSLSRSVSEVLQRMVRKNGNNVLSSVDNDMICALDNVSFKVDKGEVLGIIGANGSGKTTILRLLANVTVPSSGEILVLGRVAPLIQIGAGFHPELTGRENVHLSATIMGLSRKEIDERYDDIVSFAELERFMDTPVKRYSSGMFVRLGFAVAVYIDPDILLIDEVLAVGDVSFHKKCLDKMSKIRRSAKTIIFVSHNLSAVRSLCDRVIWIDKGKVIKEGDSSDVIDAYTAYMASKSQFIHDTSYIGGKTRWGTGEVRFTNIEILNSDSERKDDFMAGDEIIVRLEYRAYEKIDSPIFEVFILNGDGTIMFSSYYSKDRVGLYSISGHGILECVVNTISMQPGTYYVTVDLLVELGGLSYDRIGSAGLFVIKKNKAKDFDKYHSYSPRGVISMPHEWRKIE